MTTHKMYTDGIRPPRGLGYVDAKDLLAIHPHELEERESKHNSAAKKPKHEHVTANGNNQKALKQENISKLFSGLSDWLDMLESANFLAQFFESRLNSNSTLRDTDELAYRFEGEHKLTKLNNKKN